MPNGKPGDHPLTDVLAHEFEVYGPEADDLIRKIAELSGGHATFKWWEKEIGWACDHELVLEKSRRHYDKLLERGGQPEPSSWLRYLNPRNWFGD